MQFSNADELWVDAIDSCLDSPLAGPSRDGDVCGETIGWTATLTDIARNFVYCPVRRLSPAFAAAEVLWYLSGDVSINRIVPYAPSYTKYGNPTKMRVNESGYEDPSGTREEVLIASTGAAYGRRLASLDAENRTIFSGVLELLKNKPNTRQAVVGIWDPKYDGFHARKGDLASIPCTLSLQYLIRDNRLHCVCTMRSNDVWLGLPHDMFSFTTIQRLVADALGLEYGHYHHHVGSLHIYDRNREKCDLVTRSTWTVPEAGHEYSPVIDSHLVEHMKSAVDLEAANRRNKACYRGCEDLLGRNSILLQLVCMAASKWDSPGSGGSSVKRMPDKELRKYSEKYYAGH